MLRLGQYRLIAEMYDEDSTRYSAICEFNISVNSYEVYAEMTETDPTHRVTGEQIAAVSHGMTWDEVTALIGKPTEIVGMKDGKIHVRYKCENLKAQGLTVVYEVVVYLDGNGVQRAELWVEYKYFT